MENTYIIDFDEDNPELGLVANSFVADPAVAIDEGVKLFAFNKEAKHIHFNKDSEQKFLSVSILANTPIPRKFGKVIFTEEVIDKLILSMVKNNHINKVTFNHNGQLIEGIYLTSHFKLKKGRVESPLFEGVPEGSWVTEYYVEDKELYETLKNTPHFNGFSVEIKGWLEEQEEKAIENHFKAILEDECLSDEDKYSKISSYLTQID